MDNTSEDRYFKYDKDLLTEIKRFAINSGWNENFVRTMFSNMLKHRSAFERGSIYAIEDINDGIWQSHPPRSEFDKEGWIKGYIKTRIRGKLSLEIVKRTCALFNSIILDDDFQERKNKSELTLNDVVNVMRPGDYYAHGYMTFLDVNLEESNILVCLSRCNKCDMEFKTIHYYIPEFSNSIIKLHNEKCFNCYILRREGWLDSDDFAGGLKGLLKNV